MRVSCCFTHRLFVFTPDNAARGSSCSPAYAAGGLAHAHQCAQGQPRNTRHLRLRKKLQCISLSCLAESALAAASAACPCSVLYTTIMASGLACKAGLVADAELECQRSSAHAAARAAGPIVWSASRRSPWDDALRVYCAWQCGPALDDSPRSRAGR